MPIGSTVKGGSVSQAPNTPGSVQSDWIVLNSDAETAQSAAELLSPGDVDDASFYWVMVPPASTRIIIAGTVDVTSGSLTSVDTDPVVRLYGIKNIGGSDDPAETLTYYPQRIDSPTDTTDAGITVDFGTYVTDTLYITDNEAVTTAHITPLTNADGYDLLGCKYVGAMVATAAAKTGTTGPNGFQIIGSFLN